tara:strand:+ start:20090 stop:20380 length:291 start_codon:yes stop_codon:yes gene_type:complete
MRGLKFLVIFMGILIILGTSFLVYTIIKRGNKMLTSQNYISNNHSLEINSPKNMKLKNVTSNDQNIILKFENDKKYTIQIINLKTGELLKKININK